MPDTPVSPLERLRLRPDAASWQRLIDLYTPLIRTWLQRYVLQSPDADDLVQEEDPQSALSRLWDQEHDRHVVRRLLELIEPDFEPATWRAFQLLVLEGKPTREVAATLGISTNAVRIAKFRILSRFRQEIAGLLD